nr:hypothetical protein [Tanacetum cinerariifolium]
MEHYISHTDYLIWQVIQNGNGHVSVIIDTNGMVKVLPPKTVEEVVARERGRKTKTPLLMALPEDHLAKFHKMDDAKEMCEAIKSRFGIHGAGVLHEDANQKFLRFLPSSWSHMALIMITKPRLDTLSFDDLYNNLRVFKRDVKGTTASSSSNTQNVAFVSADNTSSTNDINDDDMEEMDLKWQVTMISMRINKFHKRIGRKLQFDTRDPVDIKRKDAWYNENKARDNGRRPAYQDNMKALVTIDGEDIDWSGHVEKDTQNYAMMSGHVEEDTQNFAMMAYSSSNSGSDNELPDENQVLFKIPRQHNMYSFNIKNIDPFGDLSCLFAKASIDESNKWHRRLGIKREYSNARTPQQNEVAERKNKTLIEAARTMVLVTKSQNKTPYELLTGRQPIISYLRPFGCHVTILNTIDQLGKFDGKSDSGFLVGYSLNSKAFRVYNLETQRVEENLHVTFLENKPNVAGEGHAWMFDLDYVTNSMNYEPVSLENQANKSAGPQEANISAGTQANDDQGKNSEEIDLHDEHFVLPIWSAYSTFIKSSRDKIGKNDKPVSQVEQILQEGVGNKMLKETRFKRPLIARHVRSNTNLLNVVSTPISTASPSIALNDDEPSYPDDPSMPHLEDIYASPSEGIFTDSSYDAEGVTRSKVNKNYEAHALVSYILKQQRNNHKDFQHCLFACFLSQIEPKKISQALKDESQKAIGTKWVYMNKKDERRVVVRNKARLVTEGHRQEEGIDYDEFFLLSKFPNKVYKVVKALYGLHQAPRAWYATLSTILVKSRYRRGAVDKTLFIKQDKKDIMLVQVYVDDIIFGSRISLGTASTPIDTQKSFVKDEEAVDVDVTPKTSHLQAVKRIFSDYAGANLDKKSTTGGCEFLGRRLISWQCKKRTIVASSTIEEEYVDAAHCCGQVL